MSRNKSIKCYQCKKVIKENVKEEYLGRKLIYLHDGECYEKLLERKQETENFNWLCSYVKDIYGESDLEMPTGYCSSLWDLRNGTVRYIKGGVVIDKNMQKDGVPFDVLIEAYQLAEKNIKWSLESKSFKSRSQKYAYGLAIAKNKIQAVLAKRKTKEQQDRVNELKCNVIIEEEIVAYKDRKHKPDKPVDDISDLFE